MNIRRSVVTAVAVAALVSPLPLLYAQSITDPEVAERTVVVQNPKASGNVVSGQIVNRSPHVIRDVELLVQYHWMWQDEFAPGENSPGQAAYITVDKEIPPDSTVPFSSTAEQPPQTEKRGYFVPEVSIAGFTVVVPPEQVGQPVRGGHTNP